LYNLYYWILAVHFEVQNSGDKWLEKCLVSDNTDTTINCNFVKTLFYIPLLTVLGCSNPTKSTDTKLHSDTISDQSNTRQDGNSKYYTTKDILVIATETGDTLNYSKSEFNSIIDNHPELYNDNVQDPDPTYYCADNKSGFSSETGQDEHYMLYAYFLKQKNGISKYADLRKRLIDIYSNINSLYQHFQHGGTYFGHQGSRILAYAEFSVYLYKYYEDRLSKTYDINKQTSLYIQFLRQLVDDEIQNDGETSAKDKVKSKQELNAMVDNIDKEITDSFCLQRTQEFQYEHYQYY
jgi:hypothetical protein